MTVRLHPCQKPKAVAIVLAHLGATATQMQSYAEWYKQRHCSVVVAASPPLRFMCNASLEETGRNILENVRMALKEANDSSDSFSVFEIPVVMHIMSNGGAFLLEQFELLLANDISNNNTSQSSQPTITNQEISNRLKAGYQLFDSCPCYIRLLWNTSNFSSSFPNPRWTLQTFQPIYTLGSSISLTAWCTMTLAWNRPSQFWKRMEESTACPHAIYIYSSCDLLSDAFQTECLIAKRQEYLPNLQVSQHRYEDSNHCQMHMDHPDEYANIIDESLDGAIGRARAKC